MTKEIIYILIVSVYAIVTFYLHYKTHQKYIRTKEELKKHTNKKCFECDKRTYRDKTK